MTSEMYSPIILSLQCAFVSALINIPWGLYWGWTLARKSFPGKRVAEVLLYMPLVLPPVLTGYFLLELFSLNAPLGQILKQFFGLVFILNWKGAVLAATVVSSPFMIQMVREAVHAVDPRLELAARNLGATPVRVWKTIMLPLIWPGVMAGFFLTFARSVGEFGATMLLAGNIPGKTQTIPLAIYSRVYLGQDRAIVPLVIAAMVLAYVGLLFSQTAGQRKGRDTHD